VEFDVVIEIPKGQRNKYEMDHDSGRIRLDRMLFTSTRYPGRLRLRGAQPSPMTATPLDALVLLEEPTFPGLPDPVPRDRDVPDARREGRGMTRCCACRPPTRGSLSSRTSPTCPTSTCWKSSTSSRSTRPWSPARRSRIAGWVGMADADAEIDACPGPAGPRRAALIYHGTAANGRNGPVLGRAEVVLVRAMGNTS